MRIAVNAGTFTPEDFDFFFGLARLHPLDTFLFFFDTPPAALSFPENSTPVVLAPEAVIPLKWQIWYHLKLPAALKKHQAEIFIGKKFISLKTSLPQILMHPDLAFLHQPSMVPKKHLRFYQKNTPRFLNKAKIMIVNCHLFKKDLMDRYGVPEQNIQVIYPEIEKGFKVLNDEERELVKEKYADGNEYFIYKGTLGTQQNLINLLKAFSFFKKRQKSRMQLILLGKAGPDDDQFLESLRLFRFSKEVKVLQDVSKNEMHKILAAAYAMVQVPLYTSSPLEVLEAMTCHLPLLVSDSEIMNEFCGDAALYAAPDNFKDIAEKMMLLFKDEQRSKELIGKERSRLPQFIHPGSGIFYETIIHTVTKVPPGMKGS